MSSLNIKINQKSNIPLYKQIADSISKQIDKGQIVKGAILPSINVFSKEFSVARDTIENAYKILKKEGYISSVKSRGYFVIGKKEKRLRVLLVLNKISFFKKIVYYSFLNALKKKALVDLQIHHYNPALLKEILEKNLGLYDYFVIMPHFETNTPKAEYIEVLKMVPENELVILDKSVPEIFGSMSVTQDFMYDTYGALASFKNQFEKYEEIILLFPEFSNHPLEIIEGIQLFCKQNKFKLKKRSDSLHLKLVKKQCYIVIEDDDLTTLIKQTRVDKLVIGKDIGILSFNETQLKELLDISVISTDFELMGQTAADLILGSQYIHVKNPFNVIKRSSL